MRRSTRLNRCICACTCADTVWHICSFSARSGVALRPLAAEPRLWNAPVRLFEDSVEVCGCMVGESMRSKLRERGDHLIESAFQLIEQLQEADRIEREWFWHAILFS